MEDKKRVEILRNVIVLAAVVGLVLVSWLLGHVLRYSIPRLWHPPVQQMDPQVEIGAGIEFEGIRRFVVLPGLAAENVPAPMQISQEETVPPVACSGLTYFTSLPAKCLTADGRLIQVGGVETNVILIKPDK